MGNLNTFKLHLNNVLLTILRIMDSQLRKNKSICTNIGSVQKQTLISIYKSRTGFQTTGIGKTSKLKLLSATKI